MGERAAPAKRVLKTRVSEPLYERWKALAERQGLSLVALQELVMHRVLDGEDAPVGLQPQTVKARKGQLTVRLREGELAAVKAAAEGDGHSLAGWVTKLIRAALSARSPDVVWVTTPVRAGTKRHVSLRLWPEEIAAMRDEAAKEGRSLAGWVAVNVRARLERQPVFTVQEVKALHQASLQLMAIGRNVNMAVKRLNAEGKWHQHNQPMLAALTAVRELQHRVDALQAAAERRGGWDG